LVQDSPSDPIRAQLLHSIPPKQGKSFAQENTLFFVAMPSYMKYFATLLILFRFAGLALCSKQATSEEDGPPPRSRTWSSAVRAVDNLLLLRPADMIRDAPRSQPRGNSSINVTDFELEGRQTSASRGRFANRAGVHVPARPHTDQLPQPLGDTVRQTLENFGDVQYSGEIMIGGQKLRGVMDTGSFELLVFSKRCEKCGNNQTLMYDPDASRDYREGELMAEHTFGSGVALSVDAYDTVHVGPFSARNQPFWEVFDAAMPVLEGASFQAIVGVGPPASAAEAESIKKAEKQHKRTEEVASSKRRGSGMGHGALSEAPHAPMHQDQDGREQDNLCMNLGVRSFSVCIGRHPGDPGHVVWNDASPDMYPHVFTHVPVVGSIHWGVRMTAPRMGRESQNEIRLGCEHGCGAVIDTGTSLIAAPPDVIKRVEQEMTKLDSDCSNLHELPDLVFNLGGKEFSLPPHAYIGQVDGDAVPSFSDIVRFRWRTTKCEPLLLSIDTPTQYGPMWILGLPFFRKYYTTFSFSVESKHGRRTSVHKQLSIARSDSHCQPENATSLLGMPQEHVKPTVIAAKHVRIPRWVQDASAAEHYTI